MNYSINKTGEICTPNHTRYEKVDEALPKTQEQSKAMEPVSIVQDGKFVFVNHALQHKLGCKNQHDIIGKLFLSFVHQESMYKIMMIMERVENGISGLTVKAKFYRSDGSIFFAEFIAYSIFFKGKPAGYFKFNNITQGKPGNLLFRLRSATFGYPKLPSATLR